MSWHENTSQTSLFRKTNVRGKHICPLTTDTSASVLGQKTVVKTQLLWLLLDRLDCSLFETLAKGEMY